MTVGNDQGRTRPGPLNRRAFFSVGGTLAAAGILAACGSNTGRDGGTTSAAAGSTEATAGTTAGTSAASSAASSPASGAGSAASSASSASGPAGAKPTLNQWYHEYGEEGTKAAVEKYAAAYPNATVKVGWFPGDYDSKIAAALLTSDAPDVFEAGNGPSIDAIQGGQVLPLDGLLGDAKDDFTQSLIERMTYDGKLYAIPQVIDMQLLVYRKSMLADKNIQPPTTFDELAAAAKALTDGDLKGLFVGNDGGVGTLVGPTLWSVGADYLTKDNKVGFTDPAVATAFGKLHELFTSGSLLLGAPTDWSAPDAIVNELCAMQWTGLWTFPTLQKELGDDFGVLPWPKFSSSGAGAPSVPIGAYGSCVAAKSQYPDAAKAFVKWLWVDQTSFQIDFATSYGFHVPARASLAAKADKLKSGEAAEAVKILQENGHAQTPLFWTPASGTAMSDAVTKIIKDGADPTKTLAGVVGKVNAELKRVVK
ncbi:ABC transporter substrate-binding protein [Nakamurella lactea]|uniref:ABC transporter substrate-binding protein n=1 Tax=Nakamurella lactea TaxID=459515 RepID=UPI00040A0B30|nr:sugar ABC transporter substrate-binding protein [Nakamurella lactea]